KKLIIPLIIVKVLIIFYVTFLGDYVNISRNANYINNNQEFKFDNDSTVLRQQKLIRIVRNEEERGVTIIIRDRKNGKALKVKQGEIPTPIID
ncbi:MAG: hypothetical protein WCE64_02845, partial [Bacteroidales bacterium]